jgi:ADP-heptose:LPS heptosyltransferase
MKVLIVKPSSLGDVVHGLRVIAFVKRKLPSMEIHWVIKKGLEGIIEASGVVEKYFFFYRGEGFSKFLELGLSLREESYDIVLDMQGLLRSAFLARFANGKICLGRSDGREFSTFFYKTTNSPIKNNPHAIDRMCSFLDIFKLQSDGKLFLPFKDSMLSKLPKEVFYSSRKKVLLFPESRRQEKCWPYFENLSALLINERVGDVIISGTKKDYKFKGTLDLRGEVNLRSLPALISSVTLVVANDSAPLHIASSMGIPVLGIFGPTDPDSYGPYPLGVKSNGIVYSITGSIAEISEKEVFNKIQTIIDEI